MTKLIVMNQRTLKKNQRTQSRATRAQVISSDMIIESQEKKKKEGY